MADTGKQSPLGINVLGGLIKNDFIHINKNAEDFMGKSKTNSQYGPKGRFVNETVLRLITWCINIGWHHGRGGDEARLTNVTYDNQINIGRNYIPALGNAPPKTWQAIDPEGSWAGLTNGGSYGPDGELAKSIQYANNNGSAAQPGPATAGYSEYSNSDQGQFATWYPYNRYNQYNYSITQWGWIRCLALQAWNEFNYHGKSPTVTLPRYEDFASSFMTADSFIHSQNAVISAAVNSANYADGIYSNTPDMMTADIAGVTRATGAFGTELTNIGNLFDPRKLERFGFPSTLLQILYENGAIVEDLNLALGASGLSASEITKISNGSASVITNRQERAIYSAFCAIRGFNLVDTLAACNVLNPVDRVQGVSSDTTSGTYNGTKRKYIRTLADCLDPQFLFPTTAPSLTVPVYNQTLDLPTGSKTYYLIYSGTDAQNSNGDILPVNAQLDDASVKNLVGVLVAEGTPPTYDNETDRNEDAYNSSGSQYQIEKGYDSYLGGTNLVVPSKVGLAAAAFRYSMLQVNNITNIAPGQFGHCIGNLESVPPEDTALISTAPQVDPTYTPPVRPKGKGKIKWRIESSSECATWPETTVRPYDRMVVKRNGTIISDGVTLGEMGALSGNTALRKPGTTQPKWAIASGYEGQQDIELGTDWDGWYAEGESEVEEGDIIRIEYTKDGSTSAGDDEGSYYVYTSDNEEIRGLTGAGGNGYLGATAAGTLPLGDSFSDRFHGTSLNKTNNSIGYKQFEVLVNEEWVAAWEEANPDETPYISGALPINTTLQQVVPQKLGLGSGPDGRYNHSDFFGCMSGLPYNWNEIYNLIESIGVNQPVNRSVLGKNYEQLYLGNTWEKAYFQLATSPYAVNTVPSLPNFLNPAYDPEEEIPNNDGIPSADPPVPPYDPEDPEAGGPEFIPNPNYDPYKYLDVYTGDRTNYRYTLRVDDFYYRTIVGPLVADGGGYKRGGAPLPKTVIAPNNTKAEAKVTSVGTDNAQAWYYEGGTGGIHTHKFGRVIGTSTNNGQPYRYVIGVVTLPPSEESPPTQAMVNARFGPGGDYPCPSESIETEAPPTGTYEAYYNNGKNQGGDLYKTPSGGGKARLEIQGAYPWPNPGNQFCQKYITDANAEIQRIYNGSSGATLDEDVYPWDETNIENLNILWDVTGRQLKVEQRARYLGLPQVEVPRDPFVNSYETLTMFVDSLPSLAQQTGPHMAAQTIEMIVDRFNAGGASTVAMMRQERNADRLAGCGIPLENTIPDTPTDNRILTLLYNGTVQGAPEGIPVNGTTWTNPSWPNNPGPDGTFAPLPTNVFISPYVYGGGDPTPGSITPITINIANPQVGTYTPAGPTIPGPITPVVNPPGGPGGGPGGDDGGSDGGSNEGGGSGDDSTGGGGGNPPIIRPTNVGDFIGGGGVGPGSPINSTPNVDQAIQAVIHCNCDCWDILSL